MKNLKDSLKKFRAWLIRLRKKEEQVNPEVARRMYEVIMAQIEPHNQSSENKNENKEGRGLNG